MKKHLVAITLFVCFRWITVDGTVAFADDLKRVPERYRASAERVEFEHGLDGYARFTPAHQ